MPPLPPPPSVEVVVVVGAVVVLDVLVVDVDVDVVVVEVVVLPVFAPPVEVLWAPPVPVGVVFSGMLVSAESPPPHPTASPPTPIASAATATPSRFGRRAWALRVVPGSRRLKTIRRGRAGATRSTGNR